MEMPRQLGPRLARARFVAEHQPVDHRLVDHHPAAAIDQAGIVPRIMIARDPRPARRRGQAAQRRLRRGGQPLAALGIVETVAQAPDFARAERVDDRAEIGKRRERIVGRQHLPALGKPARFLEVEIGHQQRLARRPEQRTAAQGEQGMPPEGKRGERKGNHVPAYVAIDATMQRCPGERRPRSVKPLAQRRNGRKARRPLRRAITPL